MSSSDEESVGLDERERLELSLRESLARFDAAARATAEVVWDWNIATGELWWSDGYRAMFGVDAITSAPTIEEWAALLHPDDRQRVVASLEAAAAGPNEFWSEEYRLRNSEGTYLFVNDRGVAIRDAEGTCQRMVGTIRDVSELKAAEEQLRTERDYATKILESLPGIFYHLDPDGRLIGWNPNLRQVTGYSFEELQQLNVFDFFAPDEHDKVREAMRVARTQGEVSLEADFLTSSGARLPYLLTGRLFVYEGREGFVGVGTNIAEHLALEQALRQETARFQAQVESSLDGILVVDTDHRRVIQNQRFNEIWKITPEMLDDDDVLHQLMATAALTTEPQRFIDEVLWLDAHPEEISRAQLEFVDGRVLDRYTAPVHGKDGAYYGRVWIFRDVTDFHRAEERMRELATHDHLTGLPNRTLLGLRLERAIEEADETGGSVAILDLDLDRFKLVNDAYGHPYGDAVLRAVSRRLLALVEPEVTVARHGGDEFLILLPHVDKRSEAHDAAQRIVDALAEPFPVDGRDIFLSGSVGVSVYPDDGETPAELIDNADVAMYHAKDQGRSTFQPFARHMSEGTQQRIELESRLRAAATRDQLRLVYQPKVSLTSGRIVSCEALLRWTHPELGAVSPAEFIPIAEDSGLIVPIGDWVLRTACTQARQWLDGGLPNANVAVNISARQFLRQDVVAWVKQVLEETKLPPEHLELELTESLIAQDVEKVIQTFAELQALGVRLSIDDFGTGYSSLNYLKRFRVDALKIDQSFIGGMLTNPEDEAIVLATISLAHNLNLNVVAEGVETEQHLRFLRRNQCDEVQGYFFSRPIPPEEFEAMVRSGVQLG